MSNLGIDLRDSIFVGILHVKRESFPKDSLLDQIRCKQSERLINRFVLDFKKPITSRFVPNLFSKLVKNPFFPYFICYLLSS
jgi:hypothetical protein